MQQCRKGAGERRARKTCLLSCSRPLLHFPNATVGRLTLGARLGLGPLELVVNYALDLMGGVNPLENYSVAATIPLGR